jgi:SAM-dependent methyltransferase
VTVADTNRDHWNQLGAGYADNWTTPRQRLLAEDELAFVIGHLPPSSGQTVLDVGIGTGRVLEALLADERVDAVYGVDVAPEMVRVCQEKFAGHPKLKDLLVCDVSREPLPAADGLNFVSAIRMLKYNPNWWEIVQTQLAPRLASGGHVVFSMPNRNSVKFVSRRYAVEYFKTTKSELNRRLPAAGLEALEFSGFTKLPDALYSRLASPRAAEGLLAVERGLDRMVGSSTLARELFVAARREAAP